MGKKEEGRQGADKEPVNRKELYVADRIEARTERRRSSREGAIKEFEMSMEERSQK